MTSARLGEQTRATLIALLEVHTAGATTPELAAYTGREAHGIMYQMQKLQEQGKVYYTQGDRTTKVWHLTESEAEARSLTPSPLRALPRRTYRKSR